MVGCFMSKNSALVTFRVSDDIKIALDVEAKKKRISRAQYIRSLIINSIENQVTEKALSLSAIKRIENQIQTSNDRLTVVIEFLFTYLKIYYTNTKEIPTEMKEAAWNLAESRIEGFLLLFEETLRKTPSTLSRIIAEFIGKNNE